MRPLSQNAYLALVPSGTMHAGDEVRSEVRLGGVPLAAPAATIPELHKRWKASMLRETGVTKILSNETSPSQLALDRALSAVMQKTAQIERRIADQAGAAEDARYKLEIALSYSDDAEIAWRLVQSAYQDLCRK